MQLVVAALFASTPSHATLIYALRSDTCCLQSIVSFLASAPNVLQSEQTIKGTLSSETLVGLAFDPDSGVHYSIAMRNDGSSRLVSANPNNGAVAPIGSLEFPAAVNFGDNIAVFPTNTGRIRMLTDIRLGNVVTGQMNLLTNRNTGLASRAVNDLAYVSGDLFFGEVPHIKAHAFTNPHGDALVSTLYGIDTERDTLVRIGDVSQSSEGSINGGGLTTIGALGVNVRFPSMAIVPRSNTAYMIDRNSDVNISGSITTLYRINLSSGAASVVGTIGPSASNSFITAIAIRDDSKCFDLDGNGRVEATSDGLMLLRALLGFSGASVPANAIPPAPYPIDAIPLRTTWPAIRAHLNTNCGMEFAP